jgi:glutamate:GABA antiporter
LAEETQLTKSAQLQEQEVAARSAVFTKELGLFDLVLTQVVFVVGTIWVGWAAKLGDQQGVFWLLAILTFYLPLAAAVIFINRLAPLEGGLYQWAKLAFNDFVAFMVAWNLWVFAISVLAGIGLVITTTIAYAIGPHAVWMKESFPAVAAVSITLIACMVVASLRGLKLGKWVHNAGGLMLLITFATVILLPFIALARGSITSYHPLNIQFPNLTAFNLNVFSKLALGALTGFEYIAILAGETKAPAKNIARSVLIAAPIIAAMFILGTSSVLAFIAPANVDIVGPIPQVLSTGFGHAGWVGWLVKFTILGVAVRQIALTSIYFTGNTRLPMVAGWDSLLPQWFTRLHPRYKTPVNSILFVGLVTLALGLLSLKGGVKAEEAFQLLDNAAGVFYSLTYLVLFAIPLFGMKAFGVRSPLWLKIACASGFIVTLVFIAFAGNPITSVRNHFEFAMKIFGTVLVANVIGLLIYFLAKRRDAERA